MLEKMLNREEKKLFSKRNINKIRRTDFAEYIAIYQTQLDSLRNDYSPEVYRNPIVENLIGELERLVSDLNEYYYEKVITRPKNFTREFSDADLNLDETYDNEVQPLNRELKKEMKRLDKLNKHYNTL